MTRITAFRLSRIFIALCAVAFSVAAQENPAPVSMQEMMKRMMPSEGHRIFSRIAGKWATSMKVWSSANPTKPPEESTGESESKLILGGRFVMEEATGAVMRMPVQRVGILGYNNNTKVYTLIFYSNMETLTNIGTGSLDADSKVLTLRGECDDPQGKHPFKNVKR